MVHKDEVENRALGRLETRRPSADFMASPVRAARTEAGVSREQLAERSGVSLSMLAIYERAPGQITEKAALKISVALGIPTEALLVRGRQ